MDSKPREKVGDIKLPDNLSDLPVIAEDFLSFITSNNPEYNKQFNDIIKNCTEEYTTPTTYLLSGAVYAKTRLRGEALNAHIANLRENSDALNNLIEFNKIISAGKWKPSSFNTRFFENLFAVLEPNYLPNQPVPAATVFHYLSRLLKATIPGHIFCIKNRFERDQELEQKNAEQSKKSTMKQVRVFSDQTQAVTEAKNPDASIFLLQYKGQGLFLDYNTCGLIKVDFDPMQESYFKMRKTLNDNNAIILYKSDLYYVAQGSQTIKKIESTDRNKPILNDLKKSIDKNWRLANAQELLSIANISDQKHWNFHWVDASGKLHRLELTRELQALLCNSNGIDTCNPAKKPAIFSQCIKSRNAIFDQVHVSIDTPLQNKNSSMFLLATYKTNLLRPLCWYDAVSGETRTIPLHNYPVLRDWLDKQKQFDETNIETLKGLLLSVNTSHIFEDKNNIKPKLEQRYGGGIEKETFFHDKPQRLNQDKLKAMDNLLGHTFSRS